MFLLQEKNISYNRQQDPSPNPSPPQLLGGCHDITICYKMVMLQNGTCYKTVHITKQYMLQNGTCYKTVMLQNSMCYTTVQYKTVTVTEKYITKWYTLQNGTFFILCYEDTNP
jgi:hypothetical protein